MVVRSFATKTLLLCFRGITHYQTSKAIVFVFRIFASLNIFIKHANINLFLIQCKHQKWKHIVFIYCSFCYDAYHYNRRNILISRTFFASVCFFCFSGSTETFKTTERFYETIVLSIHIS